MSPDPPQPGGALRRAGLALPAAAQPTGADVVLKVCIGTSARGAPLGVILAPTAAEAHAYFLGAYGSGCAIEVIDPVVSRGAVSAGLGVRVLLSSYEVDGDRPRRPSDPQPRTWVRGAT